ncbi:MAG TPA: hypothetical protein VFO48_06235, partial [Vicinamibacterales bacterium]|nr:hypothetical protein [Vicinamibacterales bacterium]
ERSLKTPLTSNPAEDHRPVWSPDSLRVAFGSARDSGNQDALYEKRADGATPEQPVLNPEPGMTYGMLDWTSDYILFSRGKNHAEDIWVLPRDRKPFSYLTGIGPTNAALSPNGRWLAYVAHEGGTSQLVVRSFPDPSKSRQQVSSTGGAFPLWRRDGRELFYLDSNWRMMAVPVGPDGSVDVGKSSALFTAPGYPLGPRTLGYTYGVSPDGQRFLFTAVPGVLDSSAPITVVVNWSALLRDARTGDNRRVRDR